MTRRPRHCETVVRCNTVITVYLLAMRAVSVHALSAAVERVFTHFDHHVVTQIMHESQTTVRDHFFETPVNRAAKIYTFIHH